MLRLAVKSSVHHWRQALCLVFGVAVAASVLGGALIMGDSVRHTLRVAATRRLAGIDFAIGNGTRTFPAEIADRLLDREIAPLLTLPGIVVVDDEGGETFEIPGVSVVGVDARFWQFADAAPPPLSGRQFYLNQALADRLGERFPDELSIRVPVPGNLPAEAPLAEAGGERTARLRGRLAKVLTADELGHFSLTPRQRPAPTLFVDLERLQRATESVDAANLFVGRLPNGIVVDEIAESLGRVIGPADYGVRIERFPEHGRLVVTSDRVFFDAAVVDTLAAMPDARPSLLYLVNAVARKSGDGALSTPYSFVEATDESPLVEAPPAPPEAADGYALVNDWLARELDLHVGDEVAVDYFVLDPGGGLRERQVSFVVAEIESVDSWAARRALLPTFPGLTNVESCSAWEIGMPMDEEALADEANEAYWNAYGPTPKMRLSLADGRRLWGNRYGDTTSISLPANEPVEHAMRAALADAVTPAHVGLGVRNVRAEAQAAVDNAMDFGQLFAGMSFFIVVGALLLVGLLVAFGLQRRAREMGLLGALGFPAGHIRRQLLAETGLATVFGAALGVALSPLYAKLLLAAINGRWRGAVADSAILLRIAPLSLPVAWAAVVALGMLAAFGVARQASRHLPVRLLQGGWSADFGRRSVGVSRWIPWLGCLCLLAAGAIALAATMGAPDALAGTFFAAGALLLTGLSAIFLAIFQRLSRMPGLLRSNFGLALGGLARRPARTTLVFTLTASGCFLLFAVAGMTRNVAANADQRNSGTGGFALFAESAIPLNLERSVDNPLGALFGTFGDEEGLAVVPFRLRDGDDASCLNLNAVPQPRILAVDWRRMASLGAFDKAAGDASVWNLLARDPADAIPALAGDIDTAAWGLQMKAHPENGGMLEYQNGQGRTIRLRLVGRLPQRLTVLQGHVVISQENFAAAFPEEDGFRVFLFDVPSGAEERIAKTLAGDYRRIGLAVRATVDRLAEFYAVEETYLRIFLALGAIGVMLGTVGLGIVALRNILERQAEFALLQAAGFPRSRIQAIVLAETILCLAIGIGTGILASVIAIAPGLVTGATRPPMTTMAWTLLAVAVNGLLWSTLATVWILKLPLVPSLRAE